MGRGEGRRDEMLRLFYSMQAYPKELTDEVRGSLKQDGSPLGKDLFKKIRIYLVEQLNKKYWKSFTQRYVTFDCTFLLLSLLAL